MTTNRYIVERVANATGNPASDPPMVGVNLSVHFSLPRDRTRR